LQRIGECGNAGAAGLQTQPARTANESFVAIMDSPADYQRMRHVSHRIVMSNMTTAITVTLVTKTVRRSISAGSEIL
jgi:hypothetical protein